MMIPLMTLEKSLSLGFSLCLVAAMTIPVSTVLLTTLPLSTLADDWSSGGLTYGKETVNQIGAGQTVILNGTKVMGSVMTGQSILCNDCDAEDLIASQNVVVNEGDVSKIMAGQSVTLNDAAVRGNVQAGQSVHLKKATIHGNVDTRSMVDMVDSTINGTLTTVSNRLHITHSTLGDLRLNEDDASSSSSSSFNSFNNNSSHHRYHHSGNHSQVIISGSSVISGGPNGRTRVRVNGPSSHSMLNGYAVTTVPQGTQVVTPEGYVYRNGYRLGSDGPTHYGLYHQQNAMAPMIEGPQWPDESTLKALPQSQADATTTQNEGTTATSTEEKLPEKPLAFQPPRQTLILDNTTIQGNVYFESGAGQVILQNGGQILGQVIGGTIVQ